MAKTVFLVDDDVSVRKALTRLIRASGYHVQAFASALEFLEFLRADDQGPACLILDIWMPGLSGIDLQRVLSASKTLLPIIFVTGHGDIPTGVQAIKEGAVDFLPKPVKDNVLLEAIERALSRAEREFHARQELESIQKRFGTLTPREREVMALIVKGLMNKQIAFKLGTVEKTVKVHRARVIEKMEVDSVPDLVRIAERIGMGKASE